MIRLIKEILFHSVLVVIVLHAFIPHPHSYEMTEKEHIAFHENSNTLFETISIAFHESNDENLDNLIVAQYDIVKINKITYQYTSIAILYSPFSEIEKKTVEKITQTNTDSPNKLFIVKLNGERGPPSMV
jgi:prenyltransferase beta subunit